MLRSLLLVVLICISGAVMAQTSGIQGTLTDEKGNPLPSAQITVTLGGISRGGTVTNFDGEYTVKPLDAGRYDVTFKWQNFQQTITGVIVNTDAISTVNNKLATTQVLTGKGGDKGGVVVIASRVNVPPLVDAKKPGGRSTKTSEQLEKMPTTNITDAASLSTQAYQSKNGAGLALGGARGTGTQYVIDGVIVSGGNTNPVQGSVDQVTTYVSGIPARYGDASGGLVSITTKGATPTLRGGIRLEHSLDGYNTNLGSFNLTGPLYKKRIGDATSEKKTVLGFGLNGEARYAKDDNPSYNKIYVLNDETRTRLENSPLVIKPDASGLPQTNYASDNVRASDMTTVKARPNAASWGGKLNGKLIYALSDRVNITMGGEFYGNKSNNFSSSPFNYSNTTQNTSYTGRGYLRFSQRFSNPTVDAQKGKVNSITNAFYTVQADYQKTHSITQDKNHKDNTFNYGYVGKFDQQYRESYTSGYDDSTGAFGIRRTGYSPTGIGFERAEVNPLLANYTSQYFNITPLQNRPNLLTLSDVSHGMLRNGDNPTSVYGLWANTGTANTGWGKSDQDQVAVQVDASFDLKQGRTTHSIEFGLYYQQRNERSYSINGAAMWQLMRLLENRVVDGSSVDLTSPTFIKNGVRYTAKDVRDGLYTPGPTDTILYERLNNAGNSTAFDKNLREKLGKGLHDYINIDALDPSTFSMDMFRPDELVIGGNPLLSYYGYDYTGKRVNGQVNFNDYFTEKDANGYYMRPIGAYRPNYIAGYISDYIQYKDFLISLGVRVDRFDNNTKVLRDPFSFVPTVNAGAYQGITGQAIPNRPSNIGDNYVVYVGENTSPIPTVIGYRNGETWYDASGNEVQDPTILRTGTNSATLQPFLQKDGTRVVQLTDSAYKAENGFTDYKPQVNAMPRINFSFQLNEDALFYAHYDVIVQRPTSGAFATAQDYYYLINSPTSAIGNPDLKPEKKIDYEVGFQQRIGTKSAVTLSAFYKERRNQIQIRQYYQAYPTTYLTYGNRDFSTNKGFSLNYELRRVGNISMSVNYTLSFNEGTGSSAASNSTLLASLVQAGYPNQRNLFPLDFDSRHNINATIDYRYLDKQGPTIGGVHFLENAGASLIFRARSGEPYTRYAQPQPRVGTGVNLISGTVNGSRIPWHALFDLNIDKDFSINFNKGERKSMVDKRRSGGLSLNVFLYVQNLLNTRDVLSVYGYTGRAGDDGYLTSAQGINYTVNQTDPQAFKELYQLRQQDINQLNNPRRIVLGIKMNF